MLCTSFPFISTSIFRCEYNRQLLKCHQLSTLAVKTRQVCVFSFCIHIPSIASTDLGLGEGQELRCDYEGCCRVFQTAAEMKMHKRTHNQTMPAGIAPDESNDAVARMSMHVPAQFDSSIVSFTSF